MVAIPQRSIASFFFFLAIVGVRLIDAANENNGGAGDAAAAAIKMEAKNTEFGKCCLEKKLDKHFLVYCNYTNILAKINQAEKRSVAATNESSSSEELAKKKERVLQTLNLIAECASEGKDQRECCKAAGISKSVAHSQRLNPR